MGKEGREMLVEVIGGVEEVEKFHIDILITALRDVKVDAATALVNILARVDLDSSQAVKLCGALIRAAKEKDLPVYEALNILLSKN